MCYSVCVGGYSICTSLLQVTLTATAYDMPSVSNEIVYIYANLEMDLFFNLPKNCLLRFVVNMAPNQYIFTVQGSYRSNVKRVGHSEKPIKNYYLTLWFYSVQQQSKLNPFHTIIPAPNIRQLSASEAFSS